MVLILSTGCFAENKVSEAWWLTVKLEPNEAALNTMAVSQFNSNWTYAKFISNNDIKNKISKADYAKFIESKFSFEQQIDLNKNGIKEEFRVGVYKDNTNSEGIFLSIYENGKLIKVLTDGGYQNFSALFVHENQLLWYRCMECSDFETVTWSGSSYFLE